MQTLDDGSYLEVDGRPAVRFSRIYAVPRERVWRAITESDDLRHWFPSPEVSIDVAAGTITMSGDPYAPEARTTTVLTWDPPHRLGFEWDGNELHFSLAEVEGGCRLELLNVLAQPGEASRNAAGWEMCLADLERLLRGDPRPAGPGEGSMADFLPVLEKYQERGLPDDGWLPEEPA